ncbi:MAG TPA: cytochrome c family protein [Candidatus Cybelea sp.]|nr:cytochrome c family protein [Candidatus Cybelea sp.]
MSLEANKIAASILVGGMLTLSVGLIANIIYGGHEEAGEKATAAPAAKPAPVDPVSGLLASADATKGQDSAKVCLTCHSFGKGENAKVGPNLWGVVGGPTAHMEGFSYSPAIANLKSTWTYENLNRFLASPKSYAPGTKMTFPGFPKVQDRANVIAFLRTQSDNPPPLPTPDEVKKAEDDAKQAEAAESQPAQAAAPAQQPEAAPAAAAPAQDAVKMIAAANPADGEKVASKCKACHDFAKDGPNKVGPNLWGVIGGPSAHKQDFNYDDAVKNLNITWTFENLDKFLASPRTFAPGTKMTFPGLTKPEDRAALLRWLRDQSDSPVPLPQ